MRNGWLNIAHNGKRGRCAVCFRLDRINLKDYNDGRGEECKR